MRSRGRRRLQPVPVAWAKRGERHEQTKFARVGEARVLEIGAAGPGIAEQAFDRPAFAVGPDGRARIDVGHDDQPVALERFGGDGQQRGIVCRHVFAGARTSAKGPVAPGLAQPGLRRACKVRS